MSKGSKKRFLTAVAALALTALVAGCSSSKPAPAPSNGGGTPAPAAPTKVAIAQGVDPTTMDPLEQRETTTRNVLRHLYDPLLMRDAKEPTKFNPVLADSWNQISPTVLEFKLHPNVKFSGGEPFDAETVKYNVERLLGKLPGSKPALAAFQFTTVDHAEVVDTNTVRIVTKAPDPLVLARMTLLLMTPKGMTDDTLKSKPDGTGPYTQQTWDRNNQVVLKAKPDYFLGKPKIDELIFKTMPDAASRLAALESGDVDVITNVPPDNVQEITASGKATVKTVPSARVASIWLDSLDNKALGNKEVRQALNYAIDRDAVTQKVMSGYGLATATFVPPYFAGYDPSLKPYPYNPDKAKQLLKDAGYPNGFDMTIMVPRGRYLLAEEVTQATVGYLKAVGVNAKIDAVEFGVFAKATQQRKIPEAFYASWGNDLFDPVDELQVAVVTGTTGFSWYSNKQVDQLTAETAKETDPQKHAQIIQQIQKLLYDDPVFIYLFAYKDLYGISKRLNWAPRSDEQIYMYEATAS